MKTTENISVSKRQETSSSPRTSNRYETLMVGLLVIIAVCSLFSPISIFHSPIFLFEAAMFGIYAHASTRNLILALVITGFSLILVLPVSLMPMLLTLFVLQAVSVRFLSRGIPFGTVTEGILLSYLVLIATTAVVFYLYHGDAQTAVFQGARKIVEGVICILLFNIVDKSCIAINAMSKFSIPLFPSKIKMKELVQSAIACSLAAMLVLVFFSELGQVSKGLATMAKDEIEKTQDLYNLEIYKKVEDAIARTNTIDSATANPIGDRTRDIIENAGLVSVRIISTKTVDTDPSLDDFQKSVINTLAGLRSGPSSYTIKESDKNENWEFYSKYGPLDVLYMVFQTKDDIHEFFSDDSVKVWIDDSALDRESQLFPDNGTTEKQDKSSISFLHESDSVTIWTYSEMPAGENNTLFSLRPRHTFITFLTPSAVLSGSTSWNFVTNIDAYAPIAALYLEFVLSVYIGYLALCFLILVLGLVVHKAMSPSRIYWENYANYIANLLLPSPRYYPPKERKTMIDEDIQAQKTLRKISHELRSAHTEMQQTIGSYGMFFDEIPVGILGIDEYNHADFVNECLSNICTLSTLALDDILSNALKIPSIKQDSTAREIEIKSVDGSLHQLDLFKVDRQGQTGEKSGYWLIVVDRTNEKIKDKQLAQSSKLATLGQMSTEMAHELNQPLNVLALCQASIAAEIEKPEVNREKIVKKTIRMKASVDRASRIINHMRVFGRVDAERLEVIDVRHAIQGALTMIEDQFKVLGLAVKVNMPDSELLVMSDTTKLEQVIINLLSNSKDAVLDFALDPMIEITASSENGKVRIVVEDNGGGMKKDDINKIFEPFYTTKISGKGTGLGGSISYGVIKEMGGDIAADNFEEGLRVIITLKEFHGELATNKSTGA